MSVNIPFVPWILWEIFDSLGIPPSKPQPPLQFSENGGTCRISSGGTPAEAMAEANMEAEAAWNGSNCKDYMGGSENRGFSPQIIPF